MYIYLFFIAEVAFLFWLSVQFSKNLSFLLFHVTRNMTVTIYMLSFLFLPGVIVHELAHLLIANLLFVPTGEVEFFPQIQGDQVKLGSVAIAKTDPLRRFLIGVAPLLVGLGIIFSLFWLFSSVIVSLSLLSVFFYYCFFEIANTMFSSRKDLEGAIGLLILVLFLGGGFYVLGLRISTVQILSLLQNTGLIYFISQISFILLRIIVLDIGLVFLLTILQQILLRRKHSIYRH